MGSERCQQKGLFVLVTMHTIIRHYDHPSTYNLPVEYFFFDGVLALELVAPSPRRLSWFPSPPGFSLNFLSRAPGLDLPDDSPTPPRLHFLRS